MLRTEDRPAQHPQIVGQAIEIHRWVRQARAAGKTIGLVPTMGALHAGHLSLVAASCQQCDVTIVTIFVNPTQFIGGEDFEAYPRNVPQDLKLLGQHEVDLVFIPTQDEMYPTGSSTLVQPPDVAQPLEGLCRPNHFHGVATIVLKLFHMIPADVAYFGQKDYQQTLVVRQMVADLRISMRIEICPTVRESDGLALSSRNTYLNKHQREQALALSHSLQVASQLVQTGDRESASIISKMRQVFADAGVARIDYIALVDPDTLAEVRQVNEPTLAAVAAHVGDARLIDNQLLEP
ncbi:MAG: pantoate--beta-alanine ligase [Planctomycetota bacterium]|nr:pantoate--beta-alanine ligase [Planctomycetota bacterium]